MSDLDGYIKKRSAFDLAGCSGAEYNEINQKTKGFSMIPFDVLICSIVLLIALSIPGYWLGKMKKISDGVASDMGTLLTDVAMPFLVFSKLLETDLSTVSTTDAILCVIFPVGLLPLLFLTLRFVFKGYEAKDAKNASIFCGIFSNCGFLGIPLATALFPNRPQIAVLVSIFNVFSSFMLLTLGVTILSGERKKFNLFKILFRPITVAIVLGIGASLLHHRVLAIPYIAQYSCYLASLTTPLSMIVMGYELSKLPLLSVFRERKLYPTAAVKLLLSPFISILILWGLRKLGIDIAMQTVTAIFISTAVSTAATAPAMARKYNSDARLSTVQTLGTTLLCTITLPLCYLVFDLLL